MTAQKGTLFGHPTGLFTLFFAEMWERFSFYGMRALLIFYMIKGFLGFNDTDAYGIYGAYTALVYMTPYFGGMLADRLLGRRRAVVLGGVLMAAGHLLMTVEQSTAFFTALALLIAGNGFFKPNISTIVGELYPKASAKKDGGFTIFYMGINLGAAMSPIICGYVGETYGWHYGFGLATIGMLIGVAVFVAPTRLTQLLIGVGALSTSIAMPFWQDSSLQLAVRILMAIMLSTAGIVAVVALGRAPLPKAAGAPPSMERLKRRVLGFLSAEHAVYLGTAVAVLVLAQVVRKDQIAAWVLNVTGILAVAYILYEAFFRVHKVARDRLFVVLILFFFNMLFWAFFEQAGSSLNNWTDRNINRVVESQTLAASEVGRTVRFRIPIKTEDPETAELPFLSQAQLGHKNGDPSMKAAIEKAIRAEETRRGTAAQADVDKLVSDVRSHDVLTMTGLSYLRAIAGRDDATKDQLTVSWTVVPDNVGMAIARAEIPASEYQAANPIYIILFGLLFSALWTFLAARKLDPTTPVKFALGILQLAIGFGIFWYGAQSADARGVSSMSFLLVGWVLITTGELCLSPVGLSMVTKLSPKHMVSTIMGGWFLATAFSQLLASMIAKLTAVGHGEEGLQLIPPPKETVSLYGDVFGIIALTAAGAAVVCFALSWLLNKWMHPEVTEDVDDLPLQGKVSSGQPAS